MSINRCQVISNIDQVDTSRKTKEFSKLVLIAQMFSVFLLSLAINSPCFWEFRIIHYESSSSKESYYKPVLNERSRTDIWMIYKYWYEFLMKFVPAITIVSLNSALILQLRYVSTRRNTLMSTSDSYTSSEKTGRNIIHQTKKNISNNTVSIISSGSTCGQIIHHKKESPCHQITLEKRMSLISVFISGVYLLFTSPGIFADIYLIIHPNMLGDNDNKFNMIVGITNFLEVIIYTMNFSLYCGVNNSIRCYTIQVLTRMAKPFCSLIKKIINLFIKS
nr:uncharacterized protein LOC121118810 [Lepeophtheirus salmonis]